MEAAENRSTDYVAFRDLFKACGAHWIAANPLPDPAPFFAIDDPADQLRSLHVAFYEIYRATEPMTLNIQRDRLMLPALDEVAGGHGDAQMAMLTSQLADGFTKRAPDKKRVRAAVALALNFWTWHRLSR